jgi:hypothetical protein
MFLQSSDADSNILKDSGFTGSSSPEIQPPTWVPAEGVTIEFSAVTETSGVSELQKLGGGGAARTTAPR